MKKLLIVIITFIGIIFSSYTYSMYPDKGQSIVHDNLKRTYFVHLPKNYNPKNTYPLVIGLHGGGGKAKWFNSGTNYRFNELADLEGFIIIYPQGIGKSWNDNKNREAKGKAREENIDDVGFISKLIDELEKQYSIDSTAIFACGISNGGLMSATLAAKLPKQIKAIGMVASNFSEVYIKDLEKNPVQPFPIILIQGTSDPIFPYKEGNIHIFRQTRGKVIGAEKTIAYMCQLNGNNVEGVTSDLPNNDTNDNCTATKTFYPNKQHPELKVELIKVIGGGHTWPGGTQYLPKRMVGIASQDFNACDELWQFFKNLKED